MRPVRQPPVDAADASPEEARRERLRDLVRVHPAVFLPILVLGCGLLRFDVDSGGSTVVEGAGVLGELLGELDFTGLNDLDVTVEQEMADQGVEDGDLVSVRLTRLDLAGDHPLDFLSSLEVWVEADGVDAVRVAWIDRVPEGATELALTLDDVDLVDPVVAGAMRFRVDASGTAPPEDTRIDVDVGVRVEATTQGACNAAKRE